MFQSKCLCVATNAPWYTGNRQMHEDLGVPFFAEYITFLTERFDSVLADVGNPLFRQLNRYLRWWSVDPGLVKRPTEDRN